MSTALEDKDFEEVVLKAKGLVLVDFWAEWCGPCKQLGPILDEVSVEAGGTVKICKMNIDQNPDTPTKYGVRSIPTMMLFKNGELVSTKVGALPKSTIIDWIKELA
ncbi:MAG: thioredoxin [Alphaproteobacteria bacterium]|nr:thioredoxin [Alphaproteobacteria bacterium]